MRGGGGGGGCYRRARGEEGGGDFIRKGGRGANDKRQKGVNALEFDSGKENWKNGGKKKEGETKTKTDASSSSLSRWGNPDVAMTTTPTEAAVVGGNSALPVTGLVERLHFFKVIN